MKEKNHRIDFIDIAKGIAILCIILGHMQNKYINTVVFTFHVPIFFIISGYFFKKCNTKDLLKKLFRTLIIPYFVTCLVILIIVIISKMITGNFDSIMIYIKDFILSSIYGSGLKSYIFHIQPIGAIWFLLALFWAKFIFNLIIDKKNKWIFIVILFLIGYLSKRLVWLPFSIQPALTCLTFLYLGYLMKEQNLFFKINLYYLLISLFIWILTTFINFKLYGWNVLCLVENYFTFIPLNILGAISGSLLIISISKFISKISFFRTILTFFGKNSLIVLCFHLIELRTFLFYNYITLFFDLNIIKILFLFTIKVLWCSFGILLSKKVLIFRKCFNYID